MDSSITWLYQIADHYCRITWGYNKYILYIIYIMHLETNQTIEEENK